MGQVIQKFFSNFTGLDLKSSDLNRNESFATDMRNAQYRKDGAIEKRRGYKAAADSSGGNGLVVYNKIDLTTGLEAPELISVSDKLQKLEETTFVVTYAGSGEDVPLSVFYDTATSQYRLKVFEDDGLILDQAIGLGFDEASIFTLADLKTAVDAVADLSSVITGTTTLPAAYLDVVRDAELADGPATLIAREFVDINSALSSPLAGSETNRNATDFQNVSFAQLQNALYISNGYDNLLKYDGQNTYWAGLPKPTDPILADGGAGILPSGDMKYKVTYEQIDAQGNITQGDETNEVTITLAASKQTNVTVENLDTADSDEAGFNLNAAVVSGTQVGVNLITTVNPNTFNVGDKAYFLDGVSGDYVTRNITARAAGSITVDGAAVNVLDTAIISNDLRIKIWRNIAQGTFFYLVASIPNDPFSTTQLHVDNFSATLLDGEEQLIDPLFPKEFPPKGKYIAPFYNQLCVSGSITDPNLWHFSLEESPETFGTGNNLLIEGNVGDKITGMGQNNEVFVVFKDRSIHVISGDLPTNSIRQETVTKDLGCISHHTVHEVLGELYFLSDRGVFAMTSGNIPRSRSPQLEPVFKQEGAQPEELLHFNKAIAINHREDEQYILLSPAESVDTGTGDTIPNSSSQLYVEDTYRGAWLKWDNINAHGGMAVFNHKLYFIERRKSDFTGTVDHILYQQMASNDTYDFMDHNLPVNFSYSTAWYTLGEPSIFKRFLRLKLYSITETLNNAVILTVDGEGDFNRDDSKFNFTMDLGGSFEGYGVSAYGTTPYGDVVVPSLKHKLGRQKFRAMRLIFKNEIDQKNVSITGWSLDIDGPYRSEMKE